MENKYPRFTWEEDDRRKISPNIEQLMWKMDASGHRCTSIATYFGLHWSTVYYICMKKTNPKKWERRRKDRAKNQANYANKPGVYANRKETDSKTRAKHLKLHEKEYRKHDAERNLKRYYVLKKNYGKTISTPTKIY